MPNPILEAAESADDTELQEYAKHVLQPFATYGITSFGQLLREFEKRDKVVATKQLEERQGAEQKRLQGQAKVVCEQLARAGVRCPSGAELKEGSAIVLAYLGLSESARPEYVRSLLPVAKSGGSGSTQVTEGDVNMAPPVRSMVSKIKMAAGIKE